VQCAIFRLPDGVMKPASYLGNVLITPQKRDRINRLQKALSMEERPVPGNQIVYAVLWAGAATGSVVASVRGVNSNEVNVTVSTVSAGWEGSCIGEFFMVQHKSNNVDLSQVCHSTCQAFFYMRIPYSPLRGWLCSGLSSREHGEPAVGSDHQDVLCPVPVYFFHSLFFTSCTAGISSIV